jgi:hypothetical protein
VVVCRAAEATASFEGTSSMTSLTAYCQTGAMVTGSESFLTYSRYIFACQPLTVVNKYISQKSFFWPRRINQCPQGIREHNVQIPDKVTYFEKEAACVKSKGYLPLGFGRGGDLDTAIYLWFSGLDSCAWTFQSNHPPDGNRVPVAVLSKV